MVLTLAASLIAPVPCVQVAVTRVFVRLTGCIRIGHDLHACSGLPVHVLYLSHTVIWMDT